MASDSLFFSRYGQWTSKQANAGAPAEKIRATGLSLLAECVNTGEVTCIDGCDSPMSRAIMKHHGAAIFEMNSNWTLSPQDWCCPCCRRNKLQISRVGQHGQILAKSVIHHDHMSEVLRQTFNERFIAAGTTLEQVDGLELVRRISSAFAAYDEILVCEDCNNADTSAKRLCEIPGNFSFSVGQIRTFIMSRHHRPHLIDETKAQQAWLGAENAFNLRMRIVNAVAKAAATDRHWYEPNGKLHERIPVHGSDGRHDPYIFRWFTPTEVVDALGAKTKVSAPNVRRWRTDSKPLGKSLPPNYLALLLSDSSNARRWDTLADHWSCPVCRRSKEDIVYIDKKGNVSWHLHEVPKRAGLWGGVGPICNHCFSTLRSLKLELETHVSEEVAIYNIVSPAEIADIISPRPHSLHVVKSVRAASLVQAIFSEKRL